jgi:quercetin dioxygenase-like cupin family protein/DNA-binding XRE family transcriptional regulator
VDQAVGGVAGVAGAAGVAGVAGGDPEDAVAEQVRRRRLALGLSNAELAARAGISKAMLSKIEHRRTSCSLTTLARLAAALAVPTSALLGEVEPAHRVVFTAGAPATDGDRDRVDRLLGPACGPRGGLEVHLVTLREAGEVERSRHPGHELLYVLEGAMVYGCEEARWTLRPGDALQLDGEGEHGPRELLEAPVRFLSILRRD